MLTQEAGRRLTESVTAPGAAPILCVAWEALGQALLLGRAPLPQAAVGVAWGSSPRSELLAQEALLGQQEPPWAADEPGLPSGRQG